MGYHKDLGTGTVESIDPLTGYPKDKWHLLDPLDRSDGCPVKDWRKKGTTLYNQTSPYGFLAYACGSGDDFHCFDFKVINAGPLGRFVILHATVNSETGGFIDDARYCVLPCNSNKECAQAVVEAGGMTSDADVWCGANDIRHTRKGWNQDPDFFVRSVARELFSYKFDDKITDRQMRFGGKRVDAIVAEIIAERDEKP